MESFLKMSLDSRTRMHSDGIGNYWFYHKGSHPLEEPLLYKLLIASANSYIEIWDPYYNDSERDYDIFENIKTNVTIKILTRKHIDRHTTYLTDVLNNLKIKINPELNTRFGLRLFNKADFANQGNWFFHDRFLILDETEVYLIGSSVGYHITPIESTGIYKVENSETRTFIKLMFFEYWKQAKVNNEIAVQYLHSES